MFLTVYITTSTHLCCLIINPRLSRYLSTHRCLIQLGTVYQGFATDLAFASKYHFNASSKSELGFTLCHFLVALDWIRAHAEVYRREKRRMKNLKNEGLFLRDKNVVGQLMHGQPISIAAGTISSR